MEPEDRLRKTPRQARSRSTVEAILAAADRVLRSEGYPAASTNRVARVAGFSVGSLYQYFDHKQAVVGALLDQALRAEAERVAAALDELARARLEPAEAIDRSVRLVFAERRRKAYLLRTLDGFSDELGAAPPLRHVLRVQAPVLADPLPRFAAAHFGAALRAGFEEGVVVAARFVHALSYALAVDAVDPADDEPIARSATRVLSAGLASPAPLSPLASEIHGAWEGSGAAAAFADAQGRARRRRETRSALVGGGEIPPAALERTVSLVAALAEVVAELREGPVPGVDPARARVYSACLLQACLDVARS